MKYKNDMIIIVSILIISLLALMVFAGGFNFSVSVNPTSGSVVQGSGISAQVSVTRLHNPARTVTLSSSGCPSSATCSFSPSSGNPTYMSTFSVATATSTPAGTYPITITGSGGGLTRTTQYTLTVTALCSHSNPQVTLSPGYQSGLPGAKLNYITNVFNQDSSSCSGSTFDLSNSIPAGWGGYFSNFSLFIDSQSSKSAMFFLTSSNSSLPGNYTFTNTATNRNIQSLSGTGSATYVVP